MGRRGFLSLVTVGLLLALAPPLVAQQKIKLRLSNSGSASDPRALAMMKEFAPAVSSFARFEPHWNSTLYKQGTEIEAIARGNLEMALVSAQEMAVFIPDFSIFAAGYVHRDADHQLAVFASPLMKPFRRNAEKLGLKLLSVVYLGQRQLSLRGTQKVMKPEDLANVRLRMPGTADWQFLGKALGATPTVMAFAEVYTGLQTGAIDGQDNPLPTMIDRKFYEVTDQVVLTSHLVDLNYLAISNKLWKKLTREQRDIIAQAADRTATATRTDVLNREKSAVSFLEQQGLIVYTPDVDSFRNHVQQAYLQSDYAKNWPKGLLEEINATG